MPIVELSPAKIKKAEQDSKKLDLVIAIFNNCTLAQVANCARALGLLASDNPNYVYSISCEHISEKIPKQKKKPEHKK